MDFKQIQELIKIINKSSIGEITIEQKDFKVIIKQKVDQVALQNSYHPITVMPASNADQNYTVAHKENEMNVVAIPDKELNLITIKSPMIGTFYRRPSPDKVNFVEVGDDINPGKVVCIIEAMKLFNEIESEISGKIVKTLVEDATPVEFDQPLFLVQP